MGNGLGRPENAVCGVQTASGCFFTSLKLALPVFRLPYSRLERLVGYGYPTYGFRVAFLRFRLPWRPSENSVASVSLPCPAGEGRGGGGVSAETLFPSAKQQRFLLPHRPHPSPPPQAGEGMRLLSVLRFQTVFSGCLSTTYVLSSAGHARCNAQTRRGSAW